MIEFQEVTLTSGSQTLLDGFSFRLADPGVYVVLGGNGSGKTLLCDLLAGKRKPKAGKILVEGSPLYGFSTDRYLEPVFHAKAEDNFPFQETLHDYIFSEFQLAGGDLSQAEACLTALADEIPGTVNSLMSTLPHSMILLAQVALAAYIPCRLVLLDGHLTFLDSKFCMIAANIACEAPFANEKYFVFTSGRLGQRLSGISQYFVLNSSQPLALTPLSDSNNEQVPTQSGCLSVHFAGEWDAARGIVSGKNFKLISKIDNGIKVELIGTIDGMLKEFEAASLKLNRIEWD